MTTKAFVECRPATLGRGLHRVAHALARYAPPEIEIVRTPEEADLIVLHVIGHGSLDGWAFRDDQKIAAIQYCLLTTEDSRPEAWLPFWQRCTAVWSYYDLFDYMLKREHLLTPDPPFNFYHAPLGVDGDVFFPATPARKRYSIGTSGYVAETEGVKECYAACRALGRDLFHLGPPLGLGTGVLYMHNIGDDDVAELWSQCSFVAGLRRIEGFELPALEGLACGSRPIVFDAPHYRKWFGEHAEYVPEVGFDEVVEAIKEILSKPVRPVTPAERSHVLDTFDWKTLVHGFWQEALR
jgi:glycosyltransferase involved in cell wall biosynthesis